MGALIVEHEGTLEHFAGDGFMTFFNDPVLQPDHAARAIGLALAMRDRFASLSADWRRRGHVLELGIGIATGYATLGRIDRRTLRLRTSATRHHPRVTAQRRSCRGRDPVAARTVAEAEADADIVAESGGDRTLKGFSRPIPTHLVHGTGEGASGRGETVEGASR